jgi:hypothetical protein
MAANSGSLLGRIRRLLNTKNVVIIRLNDPTPRRDDEEIFIVPITVEKALNQPRVPLNLCVIPAVRLSDVLRKCAIHILTTYSQVNERNTSVVIQPLRFHLNEILRVIQPVFLDIRLKSFFALLLLDEPQVSLFCQSILSLNPARTIVVRPR